MEENELTLSAEADDLGRQLDLFTKGTSDEMSLTEFAEWVETNIGGKSMSKLVQIAAFMACCDVKARDISKAVLRLRRVEDDGTTSAVRARKHPVAEMLAIEPNERHTWKNFTEMMVYWLCFTNNAGAVIFRDRLDNPIKIVPVQTSQVTAKVTGTEVFYDVVAGTQHERALLGESFMTVPARNFIHVRSRVVDGMYGLGTDYVGAKTFDVMSNIEDFRSNLFADDGQIRGVFVRKDGAEPIPELIFQRMRKQFRELMNRFRRYTEPVILEGEWDFKSIASKPNDLQLADQYKLQVLEVCQVTGVPPHKIFLNDGSKYNNMEAQEKAYVSQALIPLAMDIEGELSKKLLTRKERIDFLFQFEREQMMVKDTAAETDRAIRALERSAITLDEARAVFGFNALPNGAGKVRLVPTNMALVDEHNNVIVGGASTPSDQSEPPASDKPAEEPETDDETKSAQRLRLVQ